MGLDSASALDAVCSMTRANFYKSMTTHATSQVWQDVYHCATPTGKVPYVKVTLRVDGSIVIQFKEK
jgi:motility quorum-sensing regulator/GCU-specific mRNA interferase toxin